MIRSGRVNLVDDDSHPMVGLSNEKCMTVGWEDMKTRNVISELSDNMNLKAIVLEICETKL
jgi:hypothetical protein